MSEILAQPPLPRPPYFCASQAKKQTPIEIRFHFQLFLIELDKGEKLREKPFRCQPIDEPGRGEGEGRQGVKGAWQEALELPLTAPYRGVCRLRYEHKPAKKKF